MPRSSSDCALLPAGQGIFPELIVARTLRLVAKEALAAREPLERELTQIRWRLTDCSHPAHDPAFTTERTRASLRRIACYRCKNEYKFLLCRRHDLQLLNWEAQLAHRDWLNWRLALSSRLRNHDWR